jgi:2Fe-2S ferredoxin
MSAMKMSRAHAMQVEILMPQVHFVLPEGTRRSVQASDRLSVMLAAIDNDVPGIAAECGGACACGTCHVYIDPADVPRLPAASAMEHGILEGVAAERRPESRLACQIAMSLALDGLTVHVPDRQY